VSDYRDGFADGINFAREVIIENIRKWAEDHDEGEALDWAADRIERGDAND
jgi:hypothetical protein